MKRKWHMNMLMLDLKQSDMSKIHEYEAYIAGAEFGYNKANEWHILAEEPDVLPKELCKE